MTTSLTRANVGHIIGLDSLRFVAATWVLLSHLGPIPFIQGIDRSSWIMWSLTALAGTLFNGPAAVIVFFVLSGFCIHYPYAKGGSFEVGSFYARRFIRILPPMVVAIIFAKSIGVNLGVFEDSILWSLVAELIYYALYPALRRLIDRFGIERVLFLSFLASFGVASTDPGAGNYPSYGWQLNWLLGLPCWLLGVKLAEKWSGAENQPLAISAPEIIKWRLGVWILSIVVLILRFHSPIGYPWTLNLFAVVAYLWIDREISRGMGKRPWLMLEWAGGFSYSIYLFHGLALTLVYSVVSSDVGPNMIYLTKFILALGGSYLFYLAVEYPSHKVARVVAGRIRTGKRKAVLN